MHRRSVSLAVMLSVLFCVGLTPPSARAGNIDNFSTDQGPFTGAFTSISNDVQGAGILGGERSFSAQNFHAGTSFEVTGGALQYVGTTLGSFGDQMARLTYDGVGSPGLNADLTDASASDRFLLDFSQVHVSTDCPFAAVLNILVYDGLGNSLVSDNVSVDAPGVYEVFFSDLNVFGSGIDLTAAPNVAIDFQTLLGICASTNNGPASFTLDSFSTGGSGGGIADADGDGVEDGSDLCPDTTSGSVDAAGCSDAQVDIDGDGWCDIGAPSIGPSACLGTDNCPTVYNPTQTDSNGDGFGDACVDPTVDIPGNADVDPTATIGAGSSIDKGADVGPGVDIGENVDVNQNVEIGENSTVGDGTSLDRNTTIGADVTIGENVVIGQNVVIEDGAVIGDGAILDRGAFIGADAVVESNTTIGRDSVICSTARVVSPVMLGRNAFVDTGVVQAADIAGSNTARDPGECAAP